MRGAVIPHLSIKVFPTTFTLRRGYTVPRLTNLYKYNALLTNVYLTKIG